MAKNSSGRYSTGIWLRHSGSAASGVTVFSMRNATGATKNVFITRISLTIAYDEATPLIRATMVYNVVRFNTATPTGGIVPPITSADPSNSSSQIDDIRLIASGLTTTSVVFGDIVSNIAVPAVSGSVNNWVHEDIGLKLGPGEGLCIRVGLPGVLTGTSLSGQIIWSES